MLTQGDSHGNPYVEYVTDKIVDVHWPGPPGAPVTTYDSTTFGFGSSFFSTDYGALTEIPPGRYSGSSEEVGYYGGYIPLADTFSITMTIHSYAQQYGALLLDFGWTVAVVDHISGFTYLTATGGTNTPFIPGQIDGPFTNAGDFAGTTNIIYAGIWLSLTGPTSPLGPANAAIGGEITINSSVTFGLPPARQAPLILPPDVRGYVPPPLRPRAGLFGEIR